ncbi:MAG: glycosyltransferase family 2 protein [Syntrophales bacterium]
MPMYSDSDLTAPYITVVMPVRNEARFIEDTMAQILNQEYPPDRFEVIVADGMSDDGTSGIVREIAGRHPRVRLLENPKRRSSAGRNVGFRNGKGDLFLVVDGHCYIPDCRLLWNVSEAFLKSGADCLGRPQPLDPPGLTTFQKAVAIARSSRIGHGSNSLIYGDHEGYVSPVSNGAAYHRRVFDVVGYVDESFDACEDVEFNYRIEKAGLKSYTSPSMKVRYYPRETLWALFLQLRRYGYGRFRFLRKYPEAVSVGMIAPVMYTMVVFLTLIAIPFLGVLGNVREPWTTPWFATFAILSFWITYFALISIETIRLSERHGTQYIRHVLLIFFVIHFSLGYGFLKGMMSSFFGPSKKTAE